MDPNRKNVLWRRRFAFYMLALKGWFFIMHACCTMVSGLCWHFAWSVHDGWKLILRHIHFNRKEIEKRYQQCRWSFWKVESVDEVFGKYPMKDFWKCATFTLTLTLKFPLTLSSYSQQMLVFFVDFQSFYFVIPSLFFAPSFPLFVGLVGIVR